MKETKTGYKHENKELFQNMSQIMYSTIIIINATGAAWGKKEKD